MCENDSGLTDLGQYMIPLGKNCLIASIMDSIGIRKISLPFDWVFSSLPTIEHSIDTDFANWLKKEMLVSQYPLRRCGHVDYGPNFFNHHDPSRSPDRESYERRILRFRELMKSGSRLDFVTTGSVPHFRTSRSLSTVFSRKNIFLHGIRITPNLISGEIRQVNVDSNTVVFEIGCRETFPGTNQLINGKTIADLAGLNSVKSIFNSIAGKS